MKSKFDFTEEFGDLIKVINLSYFLLNLNIQSSLELKEQAVDIHNETFCDECESHKDHCECHIHHDHDWDDGDRAYDAWKDSQLEDKASNEEH